MNRLNLLPPEIKSDLEFSKKNSVLYQYLVTVIASIFGIFAIMFIVGFVVWNNQLLAAETRSDAYIQLSDLANVETKAVDLNSRLALITNLKKDRLNWNKVLTDLANDTPSSVRLINFDFTNVSSDRVVINGFATSTTEIGNFRDQLSKSSLFQYVDIESIVAGMDPTDPKKSGVTFKATLTLNVAEAKKW